MFVDSKAPPPDCWPYLKTPLRIYLAVMLPINALMLFLLATRTPVWTRATAALVIAGSLFGWCRGYLRRLVLTPQAALFKSLTRTIRIDWADVTHTGVYVPGGGVGATEYFFITCRDSPPAGKWDIGDDVVQVQNRPGLTEAVTRFRGLPRE